MTDTGDAYDRGVLDGLNLAALLVEDLEVCGCVTYAPDELELMTPEKLLARVAKGIREMQLERQVDDDLT